MGLLTIRDKTRISRSVNYTEQQRDKDPTRDHSFTRGRDPIMAAATEDIEHGQEGEIQLLEGTSWLNLLPTGDPIKVVNLLFPKIWSGARIIAEPVYASGVEEIYLLISQAWSARRIRGTAAAGIAAGASGQINDITTIDGHYSSNTATVQLDTINVSIGAGLPVWAELEVHAETDAFGDETGNYVSDWHAYAADCSGGA